MKKQEFLSELQKSLANAPEEVRDEIISDISEHFSIGALQGLSEEDICVKLGQPSNIAEQVLEYTVEIPQKPKKNSDKARGTHDIFINKSFSGVNKVNVNLMNAEIRFVPSSDDSFNVTIKGRSRYEISLDNNNGLLSVRSNETFSFIFGLFNFWNKLEAEISVPTHFQGKIKANSTAGNVFSEGISGTLNFSSMAGNVTVVRHKGDKLTLNSAAGNIKAELLNERVDTVTISTAAGNAKITAKETGALKMSTAAGNVKATVEKIGGTTQLSSSAGDVKLTASEVAGNIDISTAAGSATVYLPKHVNCHIKSKKPSVGSLHNELIGNPQSPYSLKTSTSVGSVHLYAI